MKQETASEVPDHEVVLKDKDDESSEVKYAPCPGRAWFSVTEEQQCCMLVLSGVDSVITAAQGSSCSPLSSVPLLLGSFFAHSNVFRSSDSIECTTCKTVSDHDHLAL